MQTAHYSKYRLSADRFFDRTGAWSVAQAPSTVPRTGTGTTTAAGRRHSRAVAGRLRRGSGLGAVRAVLLDVPSARPGRGVVPAVPTVRAVQHRRQPHRAAGVHDGQQRPRHLRPTDRVRGRHDRTSTVPIRAGIAIESDSKISAEITLLDQGDSQVLYGDMQMIPIGDGVLWLRPLYVRSDASAQASYQYILASYDGNAVFGATIQEALAKLFPGFRTDVGDVVGEDQDEPTDPGRPGTTPDRAQRRRPPRSCWHRPTSCSAKPTRRCPTSPGTPS